MFRLFSLIWYRSGPLGSFVIFRANLSQAFVLFVHIYPLRFICIPLHISAQSYLRHYIPNSQCELPHALLPLSYSSLLPLSSASSSSLSMSRQCCSRVIPVSIERSALARLVTDPHDRHLLVVLRFDHSHVVNAPNPNYFHGLRPIMLDIYQDRRA